MNIYSLYVIVKLIGIYYCLMKKIFIGIVLVLATIVLGKSLVQPKSCGAVCGAQIVTVDALDFSKKTNQPNVVVIDVRTSQEYATGYLQNAINIDFNDKNGFFESINSLDKTKTYMIYCRSGNRSGQAMEVMSQQGFTHIFNLDGGILSWLNADLPVTKI